MTRLEQAANAKLELNKIAETLTQPTLVEACKKVIHDPKFAAAFGGSSHHAYEGGLANHTLEVVNYALGMLAMFPGVSRDVVVTACIFHDYMKIKDYTGVRTGTGVAVQKTPYRHLVRHLSGSHAEFMKAIEGKPLHEDTILRIEHCILAHHGREEWGSPVVPQLPEAYIVHYADEFSAKFGASRK